MTSILQDEEHFFEAQERVRAKQRPSPAGISPRNVTLKTSPALLKALEQAALPFKTHEMECFEESLRAKKICHIDKGTIKPESENLKEVLADPFHSCALRAFVEVSQETGQFPPDSETTRKRAYQYYERENG